MDEEPSGFGERHPVLSSVIVLVALIILFCLIPIMVMYL
jgi:hypothetical protein